jgi:tetraacyldisaccharide 4'-kinase
MNTPDFWQRLTWKSAALLPVSLLYRLGVWVDRETSTPHVASVPVVSIGNATAGGAGKTPVTLALVPILQALGFVPHILTRGYKSAKPLEAYRVDTEDTAQKVGDEALLLSRMAPTWVGRDRYRSAHMAAKAGATVVVCDDAHQHYRLHKTLSLLVVDGPYGFGNGQLLPAGPLREPLRQALGRADAVIIIGDDPHALGERIARPVFYARLVPTIAQALFSHGSYLAFAGIGRPEKFFTTLRDAGVRLSATRVFADHHAYTDADLAALVAEAAAQGAHLITTEKDIVKIPHAYHAQIAVLPVALVFEAPDAFQAFLRTRLA